MVRWASGPSSARIARTRSTSSSTSPCTLILKCRTPLSASARAFFAMSDGDLIGRMRKVANSRTAGPPNRSHSGTPSWRARRSCSAQSMPDLAWLFPIMRLVEIVEDARDLARVAPDQALAEPVERALHRLVRRAVVVHRRGVAVSDRAVLGPDVDDPAFGRRVRGEREFPVLVLFRQHAFIDAHIDDLHWRFSPGFRCYSAAVAARCCGSRKPARSMRGSSSSRMCGKSLT